MNCFFCGSPLVWNNDFDAKDYGYELEGIVSILTCNSCGAYWEGYQLEDEEDEDSV